MKQNRCLIGGAVITLAAIIHWLFLRGRPLVDVPRGQPLKVIFTIAYVFTFRMFPFSDLLWTVAGLMLLYRGYEAARA
jgi:hypothetical protein